jgi:AraC family ethanolamine operon transcriptional activator
VIKLVCAEFDEFEAALYGVQGRYLLHGRQSRDWRLQVVDLHGVALMSGREGAGTVYHGTGLPGCFNVFVPLTGHESTVVDGHRFDRQSIGWMVPEVMFHIDASRPASWVTVAMSSELTLRWVAAHEDEFAGRMLGRNLVNGAAPAVAPLMRLIRRLFRVSNLWPDDLHAPNAEQAARVELMDAVFRALVPAGAGRGVPGRRSSHLRILRRAVELVESIDATSLSTNDLCAATGTSERTLRNLFHKYLGMSPHRYVMLRRLHAIRAAIRRAVPGDTVTGICARHGVWDFGRLAQQYRSHFGVLPSQSLYQREH